MANTYDISLGGSGGNLATNRMLPANIDAAAPPTGFADHQRLRSYAVVRVLDLRTLNPIGGLDVRVNAMDRDWFDALTETLDDGDVLKMIYLPKYTRVEFVQVHIAGPIAASVITAGLIVGASGPTGLTGVTGLGPTAGLYPSPRLDTEVETDDTYVGLVLTTVPAAGLAGLRISVQAEVVDWGGGGVLNGNES